jgi:maltooligosyltrehalose synthase
VAFARRRDDIGLIVVAGRLWASLGAPAGTPPLGNAIWKDTAVDLKPLGAIGQPMNALSLNRVRVRDGRLLLADAFSAFPAALILYRDEAAPR